VDERSGSLLATFPVGKGPALLTVSADGRTVYVANQQANTLSVVDAARRVVTAVIPVAAQPHGLDLTGDGKYLYVASVGAGVVTIIRTADHAVVAVVAAPIGANEVAVAR
jgi:YVTN family beta-propeller protein